MKKYLFATIAVLALVFGLNTSAVARAKPADLPAQNQIDCPDGSDNPVQPPRVPVEADFDGTPAAPNIDAVCPTVISAYIEQLVKNLTETIAAAKMEREAAQTRSLEVRLFDPVKIRIQHVPLRTAIKNLAYVSGLPIALDFQALRAARVNLDAPVTLKVENASVHKSLKQILDDVDLTFAIKDGVIWVTTPGCRVEGPDAAQAKDRLAERLFEAGEKCRRAGDFNRARTCYQEVHLVTPTTLHGRVAMVRIAEIEERMREAAEEQGNPRGDGPQDVYLRMRNRTVPLGLVEVSY
jgi:hypothetical protein